MDQALAASDGFITAQSLHEWLRHSGESIGLTTVYRHLRRLADAGRVDVVVRPDGEASYRLCGPSGADHHHHLVCQVCGHTVEVEGPEVEAWADRVADEAGFSDVTHTLEIFGTCGCHTARAAFRDHGQPVESAAETGLNRLV